MVDQVAAEEQVGRRRAGLGVLHEQVRLQIVSPAIPLADWEYLVGRDIGFAFLTCFFLGGIRLVIRSARIDSALECDTGAVGTPLRRTRAGCEVRDTHCLARAVHVQDVDLVLLVAASLGAKGDLAAVGAPVHSALGFYCRRETARFGVACDVDQPQIACRAVLFIGRLGDGNHRVATVGTNDRSLESLHQPDVFVGNWPKAVLFCESD